MSLGIITPDRKSVSANKVSDISTVLDELALGFYSIERLSKFLWITDVTPDVAGKLFAVPILTLSTPILSNFLFEGNTPNTNGVYKKISESLFIFLFCTSDNDLSNSIWECRNSQIVLS